MPCGGQEGRAGGGLRLLEEVFRPFRSGEGGGEGRRGRHTAANKTKRIGDESPFLPWVSLPRPRRREQRASTPPPRQGRRRPPARTRRYVVVGECGRAGGREGVGR